MASITRAQVAAQVHESMDKLATDLSTVNDGERDVGDYTYPLDAALRNCACAAITEADTDAKISAILLGTEYHLLRRLLRRRLASAARSQMGAGASGMHQQQDWESVNRSLRIHLAMAKDSYVEALAAIGLSLEKDPESTVGVADAVHIDDSDIYSKALVDDVHGLPWFDEGYHEIRTS